MVVMVPLFLDAANIAQGTDKTRAGVQLENGRLPAKASRSGEAGEHPGESKAS
jgi:hypothetical protein